MSAMKKSVKALTPNVNWRCHEPNRTVSRYNNRNSRNLAPLYTMLTFIIIQLTVSITYSYLTIYLHNRRTHEK